MIYNCWSCGWRINQRKNVKDIHDIGKYLLYNHKPFCSDYCIKEFKYKNNQTVDCAPISDWNEIGPLNWKILRKNLPFPPPQKKNLI